MSYQLAVHDNNGLENAVIQQMCPAIFAESPHSSRSAKYGFAPTAEVLNKMREIGFVATAAMQAQAKQGDMLGYTRHLLRMRHIDDMGVSKPDVFEVVLVNSHNGASTFRLFSGVFRVVCSNGLITGDFSHMLNVAHKGNIADRVVESTLRIVEESEGIQEDIETMKQIELTRGEQLMLSEFAIKARFLLSDGSANRPTVVRDVPYTAEDFLTIHRAEDAAPTIWNTYNVVQENGIKGGIKAKDSQNRERTTRPLTAIDQSVKYNNLLWEFTQRMKDEISKRG